ncbi:MAG: hypothetical protein ACTH8E_09520 [Brochothrix thermosphacta]|uniref:hypothetical protein n=1 Tax=Brochothrix thermosphacta TaxID=2756 RepID=UPI003F927295
MCKLVDNKLILSNPLGNQVELLMVDNKKIVNDKKYKEVFFSKASLVTGNILQSGLQIGNQALTMSSIAAQAPNGLFTSTVNANTLSIFKDGTISTIVRDPSGKISSHAGFTEVGVAGIVNPAMLLSVGMQAMSMASGVYYLNQINNQIAKIDNKLEELLKIHHDVNIGKLRAVKRGLSEIAKRNNVDLVDVHAIRNFKQTAEEVYEEYVYSLHRKENELGGLNSIEVDIIGDLNFYITVTLEANKLSLFADLIEIGTRMKIGGQSIMIIELTEQLKENYQNSFYMQIDDAVTNIYLSIDNRLNEIFDSKKNTTKKIEEFGKYLAPLQTKGGTYFKNKSDNKKNNQLKNDTEVSLDSLISNIEISKKSESIDNLVSNIIKLPTEEKEILYITNEGNQRIFVPENDVYY